MRTSTSFELRHSLGSKTQGRRWRVSCSNGMSQCLRLSATLEQRVDQLSENLPVPLLAHERGGSYRVDCLLGVFQRRERPATEVYVTGTFDDWAKSVKLEKTENGSFEKVVQLPQTEENIYYKVGIGVQHSLLFSAAASFFQCAWRVSSTRRNTFIGAIPTS